MSHQLIKPRGRAKLTFVLALGMAVALFLPFLLMDEGYFIYYGDFNVQQIPFYQLAHNAVRSGNFGWNWSTDLGVNFIGSYSFYLLGSPFFWLTIPFPNSVVPYLMAPLLILKITCCAMAAYLYLRRFVKPDFACIGGLLYAFSGFSIYNIFFNHFHEALIWFPLMLWGMEVFMTENRRGVFAVFVCLSALNNYYFFIGQAIFLIAYWCIRRLSGGWGGSWKKLFWLAVEAIIGTAGAAVLLLPSYLAVIQNTRTDNLLSGWDLLIYSKPQRLFDILHSFFFPQDPPARPNFFPDAGNKWASMSAWLPVFGCTGVIGYLQSRRHRDWLKRMLWFCFACALIPGLNAMFQLFNTAYYARWYYMMVLMLVLATLLTLDRADEERVDWKRALIWSGGITAAFALFVGLAPNQTDEGLEWGLMRYPDRFIGVVMIAAMGLFLTGLILWTRRNAPTLFFKLAVGSVAGVALIHGWFSVGIGKITANYSADYVIDTAIEAEDFDLPTADGEFVRVDYPNDMDNQAMFWEMPTIRAFHSIVPGSVMEFYDSIGINRSVASRPDTDHYALRSLLSTRWLFDYADEEGLDEKTEDEFFVTNGRAAMPGWVKADEQNGFTIYENQYYIPMGFGYDYYLTRSDFEELSAAQRELAMLKALVVEDEDEAAVREYLEPLRVDLSAFSLSDYQQDCRDRRHQAVDAFKVTDTGFTAVYASDQREVIFFSVPYEEGWSATVNGEEAEILKSNVGFMAVTCPAGEEVEIVFTYKTPGLTAGFLITLAAAVAWGVYMLGVRLYRRQQQ